ncbi:hypothetical protein GJ744_009757 [Endocarpon pusillum]|uniref:GPI inositol-deacylase winged helix domain-containing protein n=1 Tax=Endocarpon pusillum TaxID=364733 RepID=A0A8H7AUN2_9EURO|nr:hypothetical protein GJ744_009757 [Endocarpon pusillum]
MTLVSKIKKCLSRRCKKKPGGRLNENDNSTSLHQPPVAAQRTASDTVAVRPSQDIDPWLRAYEIFQTRQPELIRDRSYPDLETFFEKFSGITAYRHLDGDSDANSSEISKEIKLVIDLWLYLTFDAIEQSGSRKASEVEKVLAELASTVSEKYEKILDRSKNKAQTEILLQIVLAAAQPLTVEEANIALTLALQNEQFASHTALQSELWPKENFPSTVKDLCGLFINIHDAKLSFIHQTAREFLLDSKHQGFWKGRFNMPDSHNNVSHGRYPFLKYAAVHWHWHFSRHFGETGTGSEKEISGLALNLCDTRSKPYQVWVPIYSFSTGWVYPKSASSLIVAAYLGLEAIVKQLLNTNKVDIDSKDAANRTPLSWAARNGHNTIFEQLLSTNKVDVDSKDAANRTPLLWAARNGHNTVVEQLLNTNKVDVDFKDTYNRTPLLWAARNGHNIIVEQLLNTNKVDVDSKDTDNQTPLSYVDSKDTKNRTPLSWAAENGHRTVVEQLLNTNKVDVDSKDTKNRTPLSWAAENGHRTVFEQLLNTNKVDINSKDTKNQTPLSRAAENGHNTVVEQLLNTNKVDVDSKDTHNWTSL